MKISNLKFVPKGYADGTHSTVFFNNGYGASVITGEGAYVSIGKPYELAVLKGTEKKSSSLYYSTKIADDVLGYLTSLDVEDLLDKIANLPAE